MSFERLEIDNEITPTSQNGVEEKLLEESQSVFVDNIQLDRAYIFYLEENNSNNEPASTKVITPTHETSKEKHIPVKLQPKIDENKKITKAQFLRDSANKFKIQQAKDQQQHSEAQNPTTKPNQPQYYHSKFAPSNLPSFVFPQNSNQKPFFSVPTPAKTTKFGGFQSFGAAQIISGHFENCTFSEKTIVSGGKFVNCTFK